MRHFKADEIHALLDWSSTVEALREHHTVPMPDTDRFQIRQAGDVSALSDIFSGLAAWRAGSTFGVKILTSFPGNRERHGLQTVHSLYLLFSGTDGSPIALIDGDALTARKTAADSALGSAILSGTDARTLLMVGAGAMAPYLISAHRAVRPSIDKVIVWNRSAEPARKLVASLRDQGVEAVECQDLRLALPLADIISAATMATEPLIAGALLKAGCHVDLVGSFTPEMREADDDAMLRGRVYVDSWPCTDRNGEILRAIASGALTRERIVGDLFDLCGGHAAGRQSGDEITVFKNGGGAHLDLFVAQHLHDRSMTVETTKA